MPGFIAEHAHLQVLADVFIQTKLYNFWHLKCMCWAVNPYYCIISFIQHISVLLDLRGFVFLCSTTFTILLEFTFAIVQTIIRYFNTDNWRPVTMMLTFQMIHTPSLNISSGRKPYIKWNTRLTTCKHKQHWKCLCDQEMNSFVSLSTWRVRKQMFH